MVQISRRKLDIEIAAKLDYLFYEVIGKSNNKDLFKDIINDVFSPVERVMIAKRVTIMYLITKNIDQRTIAKVLHVSTATVAKFALITEKSKGVKQTFSKMLRNEKISEFLMSIYNDLFAPGVYGVNWKNAWRRKNRLVRKKRTGL